MVGLAFKIAMAMAALVPAAAFGAWQSVPPSSMAPIAANHPEPRANNFRSEYESRFRYGGRDGPRASQVEAGSIADCLLTRARNKAGDLLGGSDDLNFGKLQRALTGKYSQCNHETAAGIPLVVIDTALAEAILRSENHAFQAHNDPTDRAAAKAFYASAEGVTMLSLGRCLAVYSPGMVNSVLATPAGSDSEKKAFDALYAETPECGVRVSPAGIPTDEQRNALATGLYSWLHRG